MFVIMKDIMKRPVEVRSVEKQLIQVDCTNLGLH